KIAHGAEAAGRRAEKLRVLDEHGLAYEEITEVDPDVDPVVETLLEWQFDTQADRHATGLGGAAVGRLHHAGSAAGDHRVARLGERRAQVGGHLTLGAVRLAARRAEDADRGRQVGERV